MCVRVYLVVETQQNGLLMGKGDGGGGCRKDNHVKDGKRVE